MRENVMRKLKVVLNEDEAKALETLRDSCPDLTDHRLLVGTIRFGLDQLQRNPGRIKAYVECRTGRYPR